VGTIGKHNIDDAGLQGGLQGGAPNLPKKAPSTSEEIGQRLDTFASSGARHSNRVGNLIDVCPVGALTSLPYSFRSRPWELKKIETFDTLSGERSPIRRDTRGVGPQSLLRVLPRVDNGHELPWIGDKTRFGYDARGRQRVAGPRVPFYGTLDHCDWSLCFQVLGALYRTWGAHREIRLGTSTSRETIAAVKGFAKFYSNLFIPSGKFTASISS
jgi:NADH dehydrogenase/NADH:ubiquinone oxidoreductase subunit G